MLRNYLSPKVYYPTVIAMY